MLRTNWKYALSLKLIDQYAQSNDHQNHDQECHRLFSHGSAISHGVSMKLDSDLPTTLMVDGLYRMSGTRTSAKAWKTQRQALHECLGSEVSTTNSFTASVDKRTIYICWRLVTPRSSNPSFGWMIKTMEAVHLKTYLSGQLNVFGIEAGFKRKQSATH